MFLPNKVLEQLEHEIEQFSSHFPFPSLHLLLVHIYQSQQIVEGVGFVALVEREHFAERLGLHSTHLLQCVQDYSILGIQLGEAFLIPLGLSRELLVQHFKELLVVEEVREEFVQNSLFGGSDLGIDFIDSVEMILIIGVHF